MRSLYFLLIALCLLAAPAFAQTAEAPAADTPPATEQAAPAANASQDFSTTHKKAKKHKKKKAAAKPQRRVRVKVDPNDQPVDPAVSQPTEFIDAIKTRAQRAFWEGKKTPNQQQAEFDQAQAGVVPASFTRVSESVLTGVTFYDQPINMPPSDAFQSSLDTVALELGKSCGTHEYLGWPLSQSEQVRVDTIFADTNAKLNGRGFSLMPKRPRNVSGDVSVFVADRVSKLNTSHVLGMWSAGDVGLLLLMCDLQPPAPKMTAPVKSKKAARKSRSAKKNTAVTAPASASAPTTPEPPLSSAGTDSAPAPDARPQVVPGKAPAAVPDSLPPVTPAPTSQPTPAFTPSSSTNAQPTPAATPPAETAPPAPAAVAPAVDSPTTAAAPAKPADAKPAEEKPAEEKPADAKPAEEKPAEAGTSTSGAAVKVEPPQAEAKPEEKPRSNAFDKPPESAAKTDAPAEKPVDPSATTAPLSGAPASSASP